MTTRDAIFRAFVQRYDAATGVVSCTIPKLYGRTVLTARPAVGQPSEITSISPPAVNSVVFVFFDGGADNSPFWIPRVLDSAYTDMFVNIAGDTMTGALAGVGATFSGDVAVNGGDLTTTSGTATLFNTGATTLNIGGAATTVSLGAGGSTVTIPGDVAVNGGDLTTTAATATLFNANATTVNIAQAATTISIGAISGTTTVRNSLSVTGNFSSTGAGTNEQQTIQVTGSPTGGTFVLSLLGTTVTLNWNSSVAQTQTALDAALGAGNTVVSGGTFPGATQTISFASAFAAANVPQAVLATNSLTGGTTPSVTITMPTAGVGSIGTGSASSTGNVSGVRAIFDQVYAGRTWMATATGSPLTIRTNDSISSAIVIPATTHVTSERAGITIGDWVMGQDVAGNGTKDFFVWNGTPRIKINPLGRITIPTASSDTPNHETVRFVGDSAYIAFWESSEVTRRGFVQGVTGGLTIGADSGNLDLYGNSQLFRINSGYALLNGYMRIGTWPASGAYTGLVDRASGAANNYMIISDTADTYISTPGATGQIYLRPRNNGTAGQLQVNNTQAVFQNQVVVGRNGGSAGGGATGDGYTNASVYIDAANIQGGATGHTASISFHPGGVAPQLRCGYNINTIYVRDLNGIANATLSGELDDTSSRRYKQDIHTWPGRSLSAAALDAVSIVRALRPVKFRYDEKGALSQPLPERRERALARLNAYNERAGRELYERPLHSCSHDTCGGSADDPCARVLKHRTGKLGFIAEEVIELVPEAVSLNADKQPEGLSATALLAVVVSAVQTLTDRIEELEAKLAA